MYTANTEKEPEDKISTLAPQAGESRPMWIVRVLTSLRTWWNKPSSRIGLVGPLLAGCLLCQGCATSAPRVVGALGGAAAGFVICHNYLVAEQTQYEHDEVAAGRLPLSPSNGEMIWQNKWLYLGSVGAGGLTGWMIADWASDDADGGDVVNNTTVNNDNRTLPAEPSAVDPTGTATAEARKRGR